MVTLQLTNIYHQCVKNWQTEENKQTKTKQTHTDHHNQQNHSGPKMKAYKNKNLVYRLYLPFYSQERFLVQTSQDVQIAAPCYTLKSTCQLVREGGGVNLFFRKKSHFILVQQLLKDNDYVIVNKKPWFKEYSKFFPPKSLNQNYFWKNFVLCFQVLHIQTQFKKSIGSY